MLDSADLLLQLPDWDKSAGAIAERTVAAKAGVESLSLDDFIREHCQRVDATPIRTIRDTTIDLAALKTAIQSGEGPELLRPP